MTPESPTIKEKLDAAIQQISRTSRSRSIALARRDGLVIVHRVEPGHDPRLAAAMAAATVGGAMAAAQELSQGRVERVIIECSRGKIVALDAGHDAILMALYDRDANLGLALHGLSQAAEAIGEILAEWR